MQPDIFTDIKVNLYLGLKNSKKDLWNEKRLSNSLAQYVVGGVGCKSDADLSYCQ